MTFRWTPKPAWYLARGWRLLGWWEGLDFAGYLVAR